MNWTAWLAGFTSVVALNYLAYYVVFKGRYWLASLAYFSAVLALVWGSSYLNLKGEWNFMLAFGFVAGTFLIICEKWFKQRSRSFVLCLVAIVCAMSYWAPESVGGKSLDLPLWITITYGFLMVATFFACLIGVFSPMSSEDVKVTSQEGGLPEFIAPAEHPSENFSDIVGMAEFKSRLRAAAADILESKGGAVRNGILLHGAPGNGKTMFARAIAGEFGLPMISLRASDITTMWVGEKTQRLNEFLNYVRKGRKCVMFMDEIDSLLSSRSNSDGGSASQENLTVVNTLLTALVDLRSLPVVIVAATNHFDRLDPAAIREGRFDFKMEVPSPDREARFHLVHSAITKGLKKRKCGARIDVEGVRRATDRWEDYSAARMTAVGEEAVVQAVDANASVIGFEQMMAALRGIQGRKSKLPEDTPTIEQVNLPSYQREALMSLATQLKNVEILEANGGEVPKGALFYGPPGTGKTYIARVLAKSADMGLLAVSGNDLLRDESKIDKLLADAMECRPCIVFIDEADDILCDRKGHQAIMSGSRSATNKLLAAMDGVKGKPKDIIWIAATNHPDDLDDAAVRSGRFGLKIGFELPDEDAITAMVRQWIGSSKAKFAADVTPEAVGGMLRRASVNNADVAAVLQQAVNAVITKALMSNETVQAVTLFDVNAAIASIKRAA